MLSLFKPSLEKKCIGKEITIVVALLIFSLFNVKFACDVWNQLAEIVQIYLVVILFIQQAQVL